MSSSSSLSSTVTLALDVKFDVTWSRFEDFAALPERLMYVTEVGAALDFGGHVSGRPADPGDRPRAAGPPEA